jgi:hypothetical protein
LIFLLCLAGVCIAQESGTGQSTVTVHSNLVMVPVIVNTRDEHVVFDLKADDFVLTDNGVSQLLTLEQDADSQPLALAIVVETGGAGASHLADYQELDAVLDALIGNVKHHVAVIGFDGTPHRIERLATNHGSAKSKLLNWLKFPCATLSLSALRFAI